ncbi:hypothetical protein TNCV_1143401 [Trichonephila clavipes]|nr:hypothetical protein TNCV_1143401 [Trichonephila clavipes]
MLSENGHTDAYVPPIIHPTERGPAQFPYQYLASKSIACEVNRTNNRIVIPATSRQNSIGLTCHFCGRYVYQYLDTRRGNPETHDKPQSITDAREILLQA